MERRRLTLPDYLVWGGWVCTLGWVACSIRALNLQIKHPLAEDLTTDSEDYLKVRGLNEPYPKSLLTVMLLSDCFHLVLLLRCWTLFSQGCPHSFLLVVDSAGFQASQSSSVRGHGIHARCFHRNDFDRHIDCA